MKQSFLHRRTPLFTMKVTHDQGAAADSWNGTIEGTDLKAGTMINGSINNKGEITWAFPAQTCKNGLPFTAGGTGNVNGKTIVLTPNTDESLYCSTTKVKKGDYSISVVK